MTLLLSVLLKAAGVVFLMLAALGVMRFSDPFQRMHAATKAGTLGAGLVVAGAIIAQGEPSAAMVGMLTIIFLLLSAPVAGHLLGRAAYVSGSRLTLASEDALSGVLKRAPAPLEKPAWDDRLSALGADTRVRTAHPVTSARDDEAVASASALRPLIHVRLALIDDSYVEAAQRARRLSQEKGLELSVRVLVDVQSIETAEEPQRARQLTRQRASAAMHGFQELVSAEGSVEFFYEEGDPEMLLTCPDHGETLLVLPHRGWFHHGLEVKRPLTTWAPDGLLRLPSVHSGPVLYSAAGKIGALGPLVICDKGEEHLPALLHWALEADLWSDAELHYVGEAPDRFRAALDAHGMKFFNVERPQRDTLLPPYLSHARAALIGRMPRPLRTEWFGIHWYERVAPGFRGEVLVQEPPDGW